MAKKKVFEDLFGDETAEEKKGSGGELFEEQWDRQILQSFKKINLGDKITGEVLSIAKDDVFVAVPGPLDAVVARNELLDDNRQLTVKKGDKIEMVVVQVREDMIRAKPVHSRRGSEDIDNLEDAYDMELPVEGRVLEAVKGGFRVQIQGQRAFCPFSQMDIFPIKDPAQYVQKNHEFLITQMDDNHSNIVVSRRRLLELIRADREGEVLKRIKEGDTVEGKITRLENFGAFVEIEPLVEGLVHVSEISWARIKHPAEILEVGMPVRVKIIKIHEGEEQQRLQISLSLKQGGGEQDPWLQFTHKNPVGTKIEGVLERKEAFGFFIKLATGVSGLLHQSKWRDSIEQKNIEAKKPGDRLWVEVESFDLDSHKISLRLPGEESDESWREHLLGPHEFAASTMGTFATAFARANSASKKQK